MPTVCKHFILLDLITHQTLVCPENIQVLSVNLLPFIEANL